MKKNILLICFLSLSILSQAQKDYKVVFDITSKDSLDHKNLIRWINGIVMAEPTSQVEVVFYGKSLEMATKDKSTVADAVQQLATKNNVAFKVCAVAMKNNNIEQSQLIPGVQIVPDGIYEIIQKQRAGWGYIKATR